MTTIHFTSERLIIRSPVIGDAAAINAAIHASSAELQVWMPWARELPTIAQTTANLEAAIADTTAERDYRLLLFTPGGELVGSSGLHAVDWRIPRGEVGYWVHRPFARRGLIREAVAAIIAHAHRVMGLRRIAIVVSDRNERSWRIPERLGLLREALLHHHRINPDGQCDHTRIYASLCDAPTAQEPWARLHREALAAAQPGGGHD